MDAAEKKDRTRAIDDESPLVSLIMPVFNAEKTLSESLESALSQSYDNFEIILVDDGSTDGSRSLCEDYARRYPGIISYIRQEKNGPASARNKGMDAGKGKYIVFIDADDAMDGNMLSDMVEKAESTSSEMVICAYWLTDGSDQKPVCYRLPEGLYSDGETRTVLMSYLGENDGDVPPYSWVRMTKKSVFDRTGLKYREELFRSEDYHFWARVHAKINSVYVLSGTPLYHYIVNHSSITHSYVEGYWEGAKIIYNDLTSYFGDDEEIRDLLDVMIVRRSLISLNNASRCPSLSAAFRAIKAIVFDPELSRVLEKDRESRRNDQFSNYRNLMLNHRKTAVIGKYMLRAIKYNKKDR